MRYLLDNDDSLKYCRAFVPKRIPIKKMSSQTQYESFKSEKEIVTTLGKNDILLGRGAFCINHVGNIQFRSFCWNYRPRYNATKSRKIKSLIAKDVLSLLESEGYRFLRQPTEMEQMHSEENSTGSWVLADALSIEEKVKQTLRDKEYIPKPRTVKKAKSNKSYKKAAPGAPGDKVPTQQSFNRRNICDVECAASTMRQKIVDGSRKFTDQEVSSLESNLSMAQYSSQENTFMDSLEPRPIMPSVQLLSYNEIHPSSMTASENHHHQRPTSFDWIANNSISGSGVNMNASNTGSHMVEYKEIKNVAARPQSEFIIKQYRVHEQLSEFQRYFQNKFDGQYVQHQTELDRRMTALRRHFPSTTDSCVSVSPLGSQLPNDPSVNSLLHRQLFTSTFTPNDNGSSNQFGNITDPIFHIQERQNQQAHLLWTLPDECMPDPIGDIYATDSNRQSIVNRLNTQKHFLNNAINLDSKPSPIHDPKDVDHMSKSTYSRIVRSPPKDEDI
jgi:hypothetical protein